MATTSAIDNIVPLNVYKQLVVNIEKQRLLSKVALLKNNVSFTYQELFFQVAAFKKRLEAYGVMPGDRVIIISKTSPNWVVSYLAILACNATAIPLDPVLQAADYASLIAEVSPVVIVADDALFMAISPSIKQDYLFLSSENLKIIYGNKLIRNHHTEAAKDAKLASILFTSGTTGKFKGVMLEHQNIMHSVEAGVALVKITSDDSFLCILPGNHIFGLICAILTPLYAGCRVVFVDALQGDTILKALQEQRITTLLCVPRILEIFYAKIMEEIARKGKVVSGIVKLLLSLNFILKFSCSYDLAPWLFSKVHAMFGGQLSKIISGGAPLDPAIHKTLESLGFNIQEGYGLTETTSLVSCNTILNKEFTTVGEIVPGVRVKINKPNITGEGEIYVKGGCVMRGYFRDAELTNQSFADGWFCTGDIGKFTKKGNLLITGRIKDLIVLPSGKKAMPDDIERRYKGIKHVKDLAILGMPVEAGIGEEIHAAIVLAQESTAALQFVVTKSIALHAINIPSELRIKKCHFVKSIPKTTTMKVKRGELKRSILKDQCPCGSAAELVDTCSYDAVTTNVIKIIEDVLRKSLATGKKITLNPDSSFTYDLGLDSLGRSELFLSLEKEYQLQLDEELFTRLERVADLVALVKMGQLQTTSSDSVLNMPLLKFDNPGRVFSRRLVQLLFFPLLRLIFKVCFHLKPLANYNIPKQQQFILVSNHVSHLDTFALILASGVAADKFAVVGAGDYFMNSLLRRNLVSLLFNFIPFARSPSHHELKKNIELTRYHIQLGRSIIIFPEATRSLDGKLQAFKVGIGLLADELQIPIVPAYIQGTFACLPKGKKFPKFGEVVVSFGRTIKTAKSQHDAPNYRHYRCTTDVILEKVIAAKGLIAQYQARQEYLKKFYRVGRLGERIKKYLFTGSWVRAFLRFYFAVILRGEVTGLENIPLESGCILALNHQSYLDWIVMHNLLASYNVTVFFLGKGELYDNPFWKIFLEYANTLIVQQRNVPSLRQMQKVVIGKLKNGEIVGIFPEGTRTFDGKIHEAKKGVATLALSANVPIVPIGLYGFYQAWPRHRKFPGWAKCRIKIGRPIDVSQLASLHKEDRAKCLLAKIKSDLGELVTA